jgi:hypothetical protein
MADVAQGVDALADGEVGAAPEAPAAEVNEVNSWAARLKTYARARLELGGYLALVVGMMVVVIGPRNMSWTNEFVARGGDVSEPWVVPGDHLQLTYNLWLWQDSLTGLDHWPWIDPYLYGAGGGGMVALFHWPTTLLTVPISLVWGPIAAYNATVYAGFVLSALCTALWLRTLNLNRLAAAVGGLAFAFTPFRIMQSTGHHNALTAWMLPALLACLEMALRGPERRTRAWAYASVAALAFIVLNGESHHSVFAVLLTAVYVAVRIPSTAWARTRNLIAPSVIGAFVIGGLAFVEYWYVIRRSDAKGGRSMDEAAHFAPRMTDLFTPEMTHYERYVYVGAVTGTLALIGFVAAFRHRPHRRLAVGLALGFLVCCWFSIAPAFVDHPTLQNTYRLMPFFAFSRVPGRLMVVGTLLLAGLAALAVDRADTSARRWMLLPFGALLIWDLPLPLFNALQDGGDPYEALAEDATILELPILDAGDVAASIFSLNVIKHPGPRVGGYYVYVPTGRETLNSQAAVLEKDLTDVCAWRRLHVSAHLDYVAVYRQHYGNGPEADTIEAMLEKVPGLSPLGTTDGVTTFEVTDPTFGCAAL